MFFFIQILKKIFYFKINFLAIINFMNIKFNYIKYFILLKIILKLLFNCIYIKNIFLTNGCIFTKSK